MKQRTTVKRKLYSNESVVVPAVSKEALVGAAERVTEHLVNVSNTLLLAKKYIQIEELSDLMLSLQVACERTGSMMAIVSSCCTEPSGAHSCLVPPTHLTITLIDQVLLHIFDSLENISKGSTNLANLKIDLTQLKVLTDYFLLAAMNADPNDIFYKSPSGPEWAKLAPYYSVHEDTNDCFEEAYGKWEQRMQLLEASCKHSLKSNGNFSSFLSTGFNLLYYSIFSAKAKEEGGLFLAEGDTEHFSKFWNMLDRNPYVNYVYKKMLPGVTVNQVIHVPKMFEALTIADLANKRIASRKGVNPQFEVLGKGYDPINYVKIRIISETKLVVDFSKKHGAGKVEAGEIQSRNVLVHIHGGGFIALSSCAHQNYLRKWAKMIPNCVIFSIDYRLAPEFVFPAALDDAWQGYYWILTQCRTQLGIHPSTIIFAGDSAGGNLAMAVALRALHTNVRLPDGLLLGYPALNLSVNAFTPSLLISLDDYLLRFNFLLLSINSYIRDGDPTTDPYISPCLIKDDDLMKFPPIRLLISGRDPLRDESYKFFNRLVNMGKDVFLKEYRKFPHGLWSFDIAFGIKECKYTVSDAAAWAKELIAKQEDYVAVLSKLIPSSPAADI